MCWGIRRDVRYHSGTTKGESLRGATIAPLLLIPERQRKCVKRTATSNVFRKKKKECSGSYVENERRRKTKLEAEKSELQGAEKVWKSRHVKQEGS